MSCIVVNVGRVDKLLCLLVVAKWMLTKVTYMGLFVFLISYSEMERVTGR